MTRELTIGNARIADDTDCYVIAEIGQNHQGSIEKAKEMFRAAADCGVNAVKLQKRNNRGLYTRQLFNAPYDNENSFGATYGAHREALELDEAAYRELRQYAASLKLDFFATVWDFPSADFLASLDAPAYKIASGDLCNTPLLKHVAAFGRPMIVSTGGSTLEDIQRACDAILPINPRLCLLQCTAAYPAEPEDMNLRVIATLREHFPGVTVGLSDHQNGIAMSVAAYVLGARVFEKHFTLNRAMKGADHKFSLEPVGMRKMVRDLHRARLALGDGVKRCLPTEIAPLTKMRKMIVAAKHMRAGHRLTASDLALKSPGTGLPPYELDRVLGKRLLHAVAEDEPIRLENLE